MPAVAMPDGRLAPASEVVMRDFNPVGAQWVSIAVPEQMSVRRVEVLRSGQDAPFERVNGRIEFTIPQVKACEVAAITG